MRWMDWMDEASPEPATLPLLPHNATTPPIPSFQHGSHNSFYAAEISSTKTSIMDSSIPICTRCGLTYHIATDSDQAIISPFPSKGPEDLHSVHVPKLRLHASSVLQ